MKKQIWKFPVPVMSDFKIQMPRGAEIISVQSQHGDGVMWAICDTSAEKQTRHFRVYGTGHSMANDGIKYIGTYQQDVFVWHLFEVV